MSRATVWLPLWLAATLCFFPAADAQRVLIPARALAHTAAVDHLLEKGARLTQQRRWADAISHLEKATKEYPHEPRLRTMLETARAHFDLNRRYNDSSFVDAIAATDSQIALHQFQEVLTKIHTYYVQTPNWHRLLVKATENLVVALGDPTFLQRYAPNADAQRLEAFQAELRRYIQEQEVRNAGEARRIVATIADWLAKHLGVPKTATVFEYAAGVSSRLDNYSSFLTKTQLEDVFSQIEGNFVGLGVELKSEPAALVVVSVIPDGPAARAGFRKGDRIVEVEGRRIEDVDPDALADMLKGPEGTSVNVRWLSAADRATHARRMVRQRVNVPSVEDVQILAETDGIGYLRLSSFQKTTNDDVNRALWKLHHMGMKRLIIDVRGNPGGLLQAAVDVADKFIDRGTIVSTRGRSPREDADYHANAYGTWQTPLAVLIDADSASASEIFAGAVRDMRRGTVVGQKSYGKGSVQGIFPLDSAKAGIRLTTAKFYSPSGQPISERGVEPHVVVHVARRPNDAETTPDDISVEEDVPLKDDPVVVAAMRAVTGQTH